MYSIEYSRAIAMLFSTPERENVSGLSFFQKKPIFSFPVEKSGKKRKKLEETGKNGKNWKKLKTLFFQRQYNHQI